MSPVPIVSVHFGPDLFLFLLTDSNFSGCIVAAECMYPLELETKVHPEVRNHGEGPY